MRSTWRREAAAVIYERQTPSGGAVELRGSLAKVTGGAETAAESISGSDYQFYRFRLE